MEGLQKDFDTGLLIDGRVRPSSDNATRPVHSPANGQPVGSYACATARDVQDAVESAQVAFRTWSRVSAYEREKTIRHATALARARAEEIGLVMAREQGKPHNQAIAEVAASCDVLDYFAGEAVRVEGVVNPTEAPGLRSWVVYQPVGVCALITPWNYPVSLLSWKLGPALATGCTTVIKPTSVTPLSPTLFCRTLVEGGVPAGVINVVTGSGAVVGELLARHPGVAKVAMTGSTDTGKKLMQACAPLFKKVSLELGGQCPAIVCADADLDSAASAIAYKGFRNCGQSCSSINRVYAHRSILDRLVGAVKAIAVRMRIGDGISDGSVDLGPMTTQSGVRTTDDHVRDALDRGAVLVCGGKAPDGERFAGGNYYLPTILTGCTGSMRVMREETFGPVVPFEVFDDVDEAVAKANDTAYGLVAYVFTKDLTTAVTVSEALEAGTVCVNNGSVNTAYGPYCGWKESGYGLELSRKAMFEYLKTKHIKTKLV